MLIKSTHENGLALLLALIVVSVVLAVGLSLLNITLKQFTLSATARDSEMAFHAANTGLECMQHYRGEEAWREVLLNDDADPDTDAPELSCAGAEPTYTATDHYLDAANDQYVYNYVYRYDVDNMCIESSMYLMDLRESDEELVRTVDEGLEELTCARFLSTAPRCLALRCITKTTSRSSTYVSVTR